MGCLLVLLVFYRLFLENEKVHSFKRFYLLGALILSISLPLISFSYTTEIPLNSQIVYSEAPSIVEIEDSKAHTSGFEELKNLIPVLAIMVYCVGFLFFGYRFYRNLHRISLQIKSNQQLPRDSYKLVLLLEKLNPHSFLNYIFLNKKAYQARKIQREILLHEKAHVDQKHSLDILFIEFIQIIFWFNPLFFWLKKATKLNHEFLADEKVISKVQNASQYSDILFQYAGSSHQVSLSSSINYSLTKKRIIMISKHLSIRKLLLKLGLFLPVLGCCLFFFNQEILAKPKLVPNIINVPVVPNEENQIKNQTGKTLDTLFPNFIQQDSLIYIKVNEDKVWVNGTKTSPKNFAETLNKITTEWSDQFLKNSNFHMQIKNPDPGFMELLNDEFKKTRFSKITGRDILPPPPPVPPKVRKARLPSPPARAKKSLPPPPPPPIPGAETDSLDIIYKRIEKEHKLMEEEFDKVNKLENQKLTLAEKNRRKAEAYKKLERSHKKIEREQRILRKEMDQARREMPVPPPPPSPVESIEMISKDGGSFFYNGKEISSSKARELVLQNDKLQIRIYGTKGKTSKMEIFDN